MGTAIEDGYGSDGLVGMAILSLEPRGEFSWELHLLVPCKMNWAAE